MFGGRDGNNDDEVMGRDEGGKDMELEEGQGPGRSEAGEEAESTEKREDPQGGQEGKGNEGLTGPAQAGVDTGATDEAAPQSEEEAEVVEAEGPPEKKDGADEPIEEQPEDLEARMWEELEKNGS